MPPRNSGGISQVSTRLSLSIKMSRVTRDGTAEPASQDQILRRERGQGNNDFSCPADHEQDWQPYPVEYFPLLYVMTIHTYICVHKQQKSCTPRVKAPVNSIYVLLVYLQLPVEANETT